MDLAKAKSIALQMEDDTVALLPGSDIASKTQRTKGPLVSCDKDTYSWSGRTTVTFTAHVDAQAVVDTIAATWRKGPGVEVKQSRTKDGEPQVELTGEGGSFYSAAVWNNQSQLYISSFSPCFKLDSSQDPGAEY